MTGTQQSIRHGSVIEPVSRAAIYLESWQAAGLEAGKFFPATESGLLDPFAPDDVPNAQPPADGRIASAGQDFAASLDEPRSDWQTHTVSSGQKLQVSWSYHAAHKTRRWNYFLTRDGWDPNRPLSRDQFESAPIHTEQFSGQPYWSADLLPPDPTRHTITLPRRNGYHVLLAVWEVADTGNGFYQVIDLTFS
ncbi:chitin-binding protein [Protofrankia sp. BMG5.30]|uniref:Chitin-binding protein n=1 Tax=Protofrankia coriariae TaxID=1562887 RepID=A0ABR5F233_9ACTN|nr:MULTISPECIES: lytic polysaccharide monooxygenase auxiliary activity family 9 protein [Protofrankia]KLL10778.1 chitin-binding protein [Protofrankia coriariae]ONH31570.1 chitin-binding protein [Protofrankia sp. BMG5.30]